MKNWFYWANIITYLNSEDAGLVTVSNGGGKIGNLLFVS